ncbi:type III restriction endonuclease subunit R [Lujinxingia vulgaris]|uniref:Type III restriction endonuclease subunit R n=1 Tax=Lujinxingia vulgaris TaxID=2600176 RepID=A0A5C6XAB5_9DELT|nr:DEAD/DEAH box helicase family protein [Lujinxingia vulgaris]TXD34240.1 type III restriction endonuclease subunit R [Lujinxingia vulgaris]
MSRIVNTISGRLSLRPPQRRSLEILHRICEIADPRKTTDLVAALEVIQSEYPSVTDFEREFPSLCFALATGVGKTRLMGAFIAYLYLTQRSRHFFVLAPNLTIYNKLIADFTPGTSKYVFQGISEFVTAPPVIITGDNYESGVGVRDEARLQKSLFRPGGEDAVHINVFNISKFNKDNRSRKGAPRMRRLSEYIGESYFDYLAGLEDLVVLMDEAHRYRADAGMKAINELKPILGLELTATPFVESAKGPVPFGNAIYSYSLAQAIVDGFVKEPAVATRKDFDASDLSKEQMERIKLEDGVRLHEQVKADLQTYAANTGKPYVKPFMLVIARDTTHASDLMELFKSDTFFEGRYANRVIEVHSALKGDEKEETVERLLAVEDPSEPTEIVIHVNMLKEGWDVTNLYTIVPLRAANARTLIEQSIGRGLRLPYGTRVRRYGQPPTHPADRLTIVAHDKFQEIVDEANRGESIIRRIDTIFIDPEEAENAPKPVEVPPLIDQTLGGDDQPSIPGLGPAPAGNPDQGTAPVLRSDTTSAFNTPTEKKVAQATLTAITKKATLPSAKTLLQPEQQTRLMEEVKAQLPDQQVLTYTDAELEILVRQATEIYVKLSIDIPEVTVVPTGEVTIIYDDFDLDTSNLPALQPVEEDIYIQHLVSHEQQELSSDGGGISYERRLEDHVVRALIEFADVDYDANSDLLYKLSSQMVSFLQGYLPDGGAVKNVLVFYQKRIGDLVHGQMLAHQRELATGYEVKILSGHRPLQSSILTLKPSESPRNFRVPVEDKRRITQMAFGGFSKCLYPLQKFHSDSERRFAVLLETDTAVQKWIKPTRANFQIVLKGGSIYEPDFVVEADDAFYIAEVKQSGEMQNSDVLAKAEAAAVWCRSATQAGSSTKPWRYLLIPHDKIVDNVSLAWLAKQYEHRATAPAEIVASDGGLRVLPFKKLESTEIKPFENCVPLYTDLKIAAGRFSEEQSVNAVPQQGEIAHPENYDWVAYRGNSRPRRGLFVAQVVGESMNKRIPNGAWCVFNLEHGAQGRGEIVLAQHNKFHDDNLGQYTVKSYEREILEGDVIRVYLRPLSTDTSQKPIVLEDGIEGELRIIAEFVEVLH